MPFGYALGHSMICAATDASSSHMDSAFILKHTCCMQTPKDCTVTKALADAQELLQQCKGVFDPDTLFFAKPGKSPSKLANYIGPVNVATVSGTVAWLLWYGVLSACILAWQEAVIVRALEPHGLIVLSEWRNRSSA